ncbi:MAG: OmpA family protein [Thermocrinis sp.]|jgi:peptidoglycan-associated lipoprotein|uniref:OmpA family protein n=1 Tax=Thermocrinis sp. TaxID=2024383 RepID=UPI003C07D56C
MKKSLLALSLLGGVVFAQNKPLDPCGSPKEVFSKHLLDQCYKGYFDAIMEAKKNADEALRLAREANNKVGNADEALRLAREANRKASDLEKRVSSLERTVDDHERRIRALEGRKPEAPPPPPPPPPAPQPKTEGVGPYKWQLEEVGTVYFDFNKFDIKKSEAEKLDEIVDKIRESGREVLVVGFADKRGPSSYNFNLSMWRAQMTASYLARKGVDIGKIRVAAYGKEVADLLGEDFKAQRAVKIFLVY